jgi:acetylornithine deacetylase/succinyl-diaminopimelate desuccinylase-like protein
MKPRTARLPAAVLALLAAGASAGEGGGPPRDAPWQKLILSDTLAVTRLGIVAAGIHGVNERMRVDWFVEGIETVTRVVREAARAGQ